MDYAALKTELKTDPAAMGYAALLALGNDVGLAPPQAVFADHCCAVGIRHFWGGLREAEEALVELGLAVRAGNLGILLNPVARGGEVAA